MKAEIVEKLEGLLQTDDITSIKQGVRDLLADFKAANAKDRQIQLEKWQGEEHEEGEEFNYTPAAEDEQFDALMTTYRERVKEHGQKIAEEQRANLKAKEDILKELESLVKDEENVGKAFATMKELDERWKTIGDVPGDKYNDLREKHTRLKDDFYYNINIYKELQENDLKINLKKKEDLIEKAKGLAAVADIKEIEMLTRSYQKEWSEIGPSPRENWKELGDEFYGIVREAFSRVQAHYDSLRSSYEENLTKKRALVDKLREIVSLEISNHGTWQKKTEEIIQLQKDWKMIGFAPKKENEEVWQEFRGLCDLFFEKKNTFYDSRKSEQKGNKAKKEELVQKANELKESTDWKSATEALVNMQKQWKSIGSAAPGEERKLWQKFRAACDHFFNAKKEHFAGMGARQEENQKAKEALIEEIKAFELSGNRNEDLQALREFQNRWSGIGYVPKSAIKTVNETYFSAIDGKYDQLKMDRRDRSMTRYKDRLDSMKGQDDGDRELRREKRLLRDKIDRLKQRVLQYENNMSFFTGPGADDLKKDFERKIRTAEDEIAEIKEKLRLFND
ncbi:DUF349 domain-containing protein [Sanyastnella coralliicola]|uniref:DUF349 domain-containing protein n=1 Tax=Sanyastnella coralliicola TaxID=3069118 RepID=UPI0027B99360|nr:DUF349 domain-containing protein [Longitalea sp. SCSIO 12813]